MSFSQRDFQRCLEHDAFSDADRALGRFIQERSKPESYWLPLAAALVMRSARTGHTYFDLTDSDQLAQQILPLNIAWPGIADWEEILRDPEIVGSHDSRNAPLILESGTHLYLNRYYTHETELAETILALVHPLESSRLICDKRPCIAHPATHRLHEIQIKAIDTALSQRFHIITGGPGTGKTTIAIHYLNTLLHTEALGKRPRIAAIAPTGKAAARLKESISQGIERIDTDSETELLLQQIECQTIHRLLGYLPFQTNFRRNERKPLRIDALIIDEASMIDLPLMNRLLKAIPIHCRVLMLGDADQLASVEVGTAFADLLDAASNASGPINSIVSRLAKAYRFSDDSSISRLCDSIRQGDVEALSSLLDTPRNDFQFHLLSMEKSGNLEAVYQAILERHQRITSHTSPEAALSELSRFMTLSPLRSSPIGTQPINTESFRRITGKKPQDINETYHGAPIIITENDYDQELFNGDLGLVWQPTPKRPPKAFFLRDGNAKGHALSSIPRYELANAMTIHKSQGSEFDTVAVIFEHTDPRFLTRELLYTAISRAKKNLMLLGRKNVIAESIVNRVSRATSLSKRLENLER